MNFSYHTHTKRCKHGNGNVIDFVKYAYENNFKVLVFTDHIPFEDNRLNFCRMDFNELEDYLNEIEEAKKLYPTLTIYSGFEAEYYEDQLEYYKKLLEKVDCLILGQHAIKKHGNTYIFSERFIYDIDFDQYVDDIEKAAQTGLFSLINHPDLFGLSKENWDEQCIKLTHRIANIALKYNLPLELNAQGMRRGTKIKSRPFPYPMKEFWKIIASDYPNIPIIISSDAHSPEALNDFAVQNCIKLAKELSLNIVDSIELKNRKTK